MKRPSQTPAKSLFRMTLAIFAIGTPKFNLLTSVATNSSIFPLTNGVSFSKQSSANRVFLMVCKTFSECDAPLGPPFLGLGVGGGGAGSTSIFGGGGSTGGEGEVAVRVSTTVGLTS